MNMMYIHAYIYMEWVEYGKKEEGETRAYGTRFSIRSINSTHRNRGGEGRQEGGLWNSREELESSRRIPGDIGSRLEAKNPRRD